MGGLGPAALDDSDHDDVLDLRSPAVASRSPVPPRNLLVDRVAPRGGRAIQNELDPAEGPVLQEPIIVTSTVSFLRLSKCVCRKL